MKRIAILIWLVLLAPVLVQAQGLSPWGSAGGVAGAGNGATTDILVGGGAGAPVWTAATGTGAPVRAGSPTFTGTPAVGTTAAGANQTINATLTTTLAHNATYFNATGAWTMTTTGPLVHVTGNTTAVTGTPSPAIVAGTTYKVTIAGTGGTATATYTLGGVTGTTIPSAATPFTITDYITANTTGALIITPANTCTVSLTSVTVEALTDATGDLTVMGDLRVRSSIFIPSSPPSTSTSTGISGAITWDANYIYICTTTNTWKRMPLSTW